MHPRTIVTGFLAFGGFSLNPSALLAESCGRPFELLEVSFAAVDQFLDRLHGGPPFDQLLMLGLRGDGTTFNLERIARNHVGGAPDVRGVVRGPEHIEISGPDTLRTTLFNDVPLLASMAASDDAGCYLCNYIYYRALRRFPAKGIGFVHVPLPEVLSLPAQQRELARLLDTLSAA